ncbi:unnamed protein product [Brachionus calyciflorus]|uniref:Reverse transcriptase domain-containing protein n=1 Tax=Brachionus calyciflorus TaxID=104777 RepID=A0A814PJR6_9BILA|nr:unnamed protein product [Brachionus calyciflorus]
MRWDNIMGRMQRVVQGDTVSKCLEVTSGLPQGSVLCPLLFLIFINDLTELLINKTKNYADDTKILAVIKKQNDCLNLQKDIDTISSWAMTWSIDLNLKKCKKMYVGKKNLRFKYTIFNKFGTQVLIETEVEKDLEVFFQNNMKWEAQTRYCCSRANKILGLVRPHIEYAIWAWHPTFEKEKLELERVQKRATKLVRNLKQLDYDSRLKALKLTNLEERRKRGDLIEFFKILSKNVDYDLTNPVKYRPNAYNLRGHSMRVTKELVKKCKIRDNFLTNRVVNDWNKLPQEIISAKTVNSFKAKLDVRLQDGRSCKAAIADRLTQLWVAVFITTLLLLLIIRL